jgi:hypothetical protein
MGILSQNKNSSTFHHNELLKLHGTSANIQKYIRTDEGGELWGSHAFQHAVRDAGYILESTAPDASFQNGMAEWPNRTLGNMMHSLLHTASLGPEYWSWAIIHATYLKNRLPHRTTGTTPVEAYTGKRPNLTKIRIFGSPIVARLPGRRPAKLDTHATTGIFLGYKATENNIYYMDNTTRKIKIATHVTFDEGYTVPPAQCTQIQHKLQQQGMPIDQTETYTTEIPTHSASSDNLIVKKISQFGITPQRATAEAAGYDFYSAQTVTLPPRQLTPVPLT